MERSCFICPRLFAVLTVPVFIILYAFTGLVALHILLFALLKRKKAIKGIIRFWARGTFVMMFKRLRVVGREHIEEGKRYVLVANHASLFDILAIMAFYPNVSFFGRESLTKIPVFGRVLKIINFVPMRTSDLRNTRQMLEQLKEKAENLTVVIFPEGTRTQDGELNRFRKGFVHLIRATNHQILPITLKGFYHLKPSNRFYINFLTPLGVVIHPPIMNEVLTAKDDQAIIETVKGVIESAYY